MNCSKTLEAGRFPRELISVKKVKNVNDGKIYALKITSKSLIETNEMVEVMKKEISVLRSIDHPNAVRLFEVIRSYAKIYLVLEFVPHGDLFTLIRRLNRQTGQAPRADGPHHICPDCPSSCLLSFQDDLPSGH
jgi:serine/threonine protein kinase